MSLDDDVMREFPLSLHDFGWFEDMKREYKLDTLVEVAQSYKRSLIVLRGCFPELPASKIKALAYERVERTYQLRGKTK